MKKLMYLVLVALFATACGGSGGEDSSATTTDTSETLDATESADASDADDVEQESPSAPDTASAPEPAEPLTNELEQTRDCVHSAAELGADDQEEEVAEVELPPAVKPDVDDEYLVPVDELITTDLIVGTGDVATAGSQVQMQYVGVLADGGEQFDASWDRGGAPFEFVLGGGQVIAGWDLGIEGMMVGGRRVLQIPSAQAYGEQARGDVIGANADLVFIVDLIGVGGPGEPAPPIDDELLGSFDELQIEDLVVGEGCEAQFGDIVSVNYVGVDAVEGLEFDSSWSRGETFGIVVGRSQVIDGWNAGIEGMKVGGERILQIPASQAYGDGDLVFRVHLEELIEAPAAHQLTFEGDVPTDVEVTTLVEGDGEEVQTSNVVDINVAVMLWSSDTILQSTWQEGSPTQLVLDEASLIPGLAEGLEGTRVGETRQIVLPTDIVYPDGVPPGAGFEAGDALVFVVEPLRINN